MRSAKQRRGRQANEIIGGTIALDPGSTPEAMETEDKCRREVLRVSSTTNLTLVRAVEAVLEQLPGRAIKAELEFSRGAATWHVKVVTRGGRLRHIAIEDETGTVLIEH